MPIPHRLSAATIERVRAEFAASAHAAALSTLARVESGDDDYIHETLLRLAAGDIVALKQNTWVAFHDWRNLVAADGLGGNRSGSSAPSTTHVTSALDPHVGALLEAATALRWAETWFADPVIGVYVEHCDRAAEITVEPTSRKRFRVVYHALDRWPEDGEAFETIAPLLAVVTRWLRDGEHADLDALDG